MASLRDIRNRIGSVQNTQQVTRAMKMVAAAKLRRAQENIFRTRPYAYKLGELIARLKGQVDSSLHPLFHYREETRGVLLIVVTADRGLAGAFNANIIKLAEEAISTRFASYRDAGTLRLLCVGRKGHEHFSKRGYTLVGDFRGAFDHVDFETALSVTSRAVEGYDEELWDEVYLLYNEFKNTISQNRIMQPLLPIPAEQFMTPVMEDSDAVSGSDSGDNGTGSAQTSMEMDFIFEPGAAAILDRLVPRFLNYEVWKALLESNASEQGARMVAMDSATTNADDLLKQLRLKYNRARQDAITKELIEITSGADALG